MSADPVVPVLLALAVILTAAKAGAHLAARTGNPPVLGELLAGVALANVPGHEAFHALAALPAIDVLARLGVVLLLFEVGLESTVRDMLKVGRASLLVAVLGVAAPFALGWAVSAALMPAANPLVHTFLGATLTATSVGITARVLKDMGRAQEPETRIILGAAVIDDVMGLILLSVVAGGMSIGNIVTRAGAFLFGSLVLGMLITPSLSLPLALAFAFLMSWASAQAGLSPIVGAYAAGLLLERSDLEEQVRPLAATLAPVFFVLMGTHVDLGAFARGEVIVLALALTAVAIAGKLVCALAVPRGMDRLSVGIGMVPRGEVGLIFAAVGRELSFGGKPLLEPAVYSAIVVMAILTTLVTPPALAWRLRRRETSAGAATPSL